MHEATQTKEVVGRISAVQKSGTASAWVFGASVNGLSFVRSLGRRGIPTVLFDSDRLIGCHSRFTRFIRLPPPDTHAEVWLEVLTESARRQQLPPVALITSDVHSVLFADHEATLRSLVRFLLPGREALDSIVNKRRQYEIARAAGIPIPETYFPERVSEAGEIASKIQYPCILKPYQSHIGKRKILGRKVLLVDNVSRILKEYEALHSSGVPFMIQEIIPGDDKSLFGYLALWDENGKEVAWLTKQKLRQSPPLYGDGSLQQSVEAPEVRDLSRRLLAEFNYRGFVGVEFKQDPRDGQMKLMEINPRTVSGNQLAISTGIDFPYIGYRLLIGDPLEPGEIHGFRPGVKYLHEEWDLKAFLALHHQGKLPLGQWMRSIRGAEAKALWAGDDPWPAVAVLGRMVSALGRRIVRGKRRGEN